MNEAHFFLFFLYNLDLHNLNKEGMICMANPFSEIRWSQIPNIIPCYTPEVQEKAVSDSHLKSSQENTRGYQPAPFTCPKCQDGFDTEAWLKRHMNEKHPELDSKNPRKCPLCEKTLCNEQRLKTHIKTIHLTCKCCKLVCESQEDLAKHVDEQHSKPCICPVCDKILTTQQRLQSHIKTHMTCTICKESLITHKKSHTTCSHCNQDLKTLAQLKKHMNEKHKK